MSIPVEAIAQLKKDLDVLNVVRGLGLQLKKKPDVNERAGPCPRCGGDDRFRLNIRTGLFYCRRCFAKGDLIGLVQLIRGCGFVQAVEWLAGGDSLEIKRNSQDDGGGRRDADRNASLAGDIWQAAGSIRGTIAEHYLAEHRNVDLDQLIDLDDVLRFAPRCPFAGGLAPCLVALVRDIVTDAPIAIQRTALDADGRKIKRMSLGPTRSGAVKLWPDAEISTGLVIGEGMETVASAATRITLEDGTLLRPAWALIDEGHIARFPVLVGVETLTILVDNDENSVGQRAAAICTQRWSRAGRGVYRLTPDEPGQDFADIVAERIANGEL